MQKLFSHPIYQFFVNIAPWVALFLLCTSFEAFMNPAPEKHNLIPISGSVQKIGKSSGVIRTDSGNLDVSYDCLCNHKWGEKLFEKDMRVTALGKPEGDSYRLWDLTIDGQQIIAYEDVAPKIRSKHENAMRYALPAMILFSLLSLQLLYKKIQERSLDKNKRELFKLLDQLDDDKLSDDQRLAVLPEILKHDIGDILGPLEYMAMCNINSDFFLIRIGTVLGELWSTLEVEQVDSITLVQPAAKRAAMKVLKDKAPALNNELDSTGALRLATD
ncbi:hypothetical protein GNX18_16245 [Microbulbifer sp. SH-1]|uniref:hypothetical protein n=1 Tax=Microbulbifer sp. SH-1 TaxID=2681547 RepID=UPI001409264D|nr:hypothetical protein [Microbulbifer sp. SH-1]QIL91156.1 hypothetical protein GNX18_16245 [Microbulbifer sp. SH-1]